MNYRKITGKKTRPPQEIQTMNYHRYLFENPERRPRLSLECEDDASAQSEAEFLLNNSFADTVEVWQGSRLVYRGSKLRRAS